MICKQKILRRTLKKIDEFIFALEDAKNIFVMGAGRSGFVAKAFAMRLMHLGYNVYVVGKTVKG